MNSQIHACVVVAFVKVAFIKVWTWTIICVLSLWDACITKYKLLPKYELYCAQYCALYCSLYCLMLWVRIAQCWVNIGSVEPGRQLQWRCELRVYNIISDFYRRAIGVKPRRQDREAFIYTRAPVGSRICSNIREPYWGLRVDTCKSSVQVFFVKGEN